MECEELWQIFSQFNIDFFTGVPDSTFKDWMSFLTDEHQKKLSNIIACNECEAIAIATGYYLATEKLAVAYMQNAGEGKTVNPITSICDPDVYSIPIFLMIGWRGEPGTQDEPQHKKMGKITLSLLDLLNIPYKILPENTITALNVVRELIETALREKRPVALIVRKNTIKSEIYKTQKSIKYEMKREDALKVIIDNLEGNEVIISTTGKTSRELFEYRIANNEIPKDFYTVGGMGCCASIALGISIQKPKKTVIAIDGDGSILMQMGSLATIGHYKPINFYHILIDNQSHDSTGGQPTVSDTVNFQSIAKSCGYRFVKNIKRKNELIESIREIKSQKGPIMLIINVSKGSRSSLGRPTTTPQENKETFMMFLNQ